MRKMGRPSRKSIATILSLEESNGNVVFFKIDCKGRSSIIGDKQSLSTKSLILPKFSYNSELISTNYSKNADIIKDQYIKQEQSNITNQNLCSKKDNFNLFLELIDKRSHMNDFSNNLKLSSNMFPSYLT